MKEELNVDEIIKNLNEKEKNEKLKSYNKKCKILIIILGILFALSVVFSILLYGVHWGSYSAIIIVVGIFSLVFLTKAIIDIALTDDKKIVKIVTKAEKARIAEEQWEEEERIKEERKKQKEERQKYLSNNNNISYVSILDAYTTVTNKLHAILNYEEVIQTRYYKFKVVYLDGSSVIETCEEGDERYNVLISLVDNKPAEPVKLEKTNAEKLREYKQLMDDGIITKEEFEKKKDELLRK